MTYRVLDAAHLSLIEPLWRKLNEHHRRTTLGWSDHFASFSFARRAQLLEQKRVRIDVAEDPEGAIVGYSIASIAADGHGELESIFVLPEHRSRGVGEHLATLNLDWMRSNGASEITIVVAVGNEEALPFYERLGFIPRTYRLKKRPPPDAQSS